MATTNTPKAPATTVCAQYVVTTSRRSGCCQITRKPSRASTKKFASSSSAPAAASSPSVSRDSPAGVTGTGASAVFGCRMPDDEDG